jgi:uncharacterized protein YggE
MDTLPSRTGLENPAWVRVQCQSGLRFNHTRGVHMKIRIAVALMLLACAAMVQAQTSGPFIAVHGRAQQEVVPDIFPVELTLKETSKDAAATQTRIESLAKDVLATLEKMKIDNGDIEVSNLDISPEYKWDRESEKQIFLGNTYQRQIKVKFHSLEKLSQFVAALPQPEALQIQTRSFEYSKADELRRKLMEKAIADAKATAEVMATGVGKKLGLAQNISNQGLNLQYSASLFAARAVGGYAPPAPPPPPSPSAALREGKITLDQDVYIVYSLD